MGRGRPGQPQLTAVRTGRDEARWCGSNHPSRLHGKKVHPHPLPAGTAGVGGSFLTVSLWAPLLPPSRLCVYHPHQDRGGLPPTECRDRVCRLRPRPEGAHHLRKCPAGQWGWTWEHLGASGRPLLLDPSSIWHPVGLAVSRAPWSPAVTSGGDPGPAPQAH